MHIPSDERILRHFIATMHTPDLGADKIEMLVASQRRETHGKIALNEESHRLIFIDGSSINTDLVLRYGRAPKGERVQGKIPRNTPPAYSIIGALAPEGLIAGMELEGAIVGAAFAVFARECLVPKLREGGVVIMDNNTTQFNRRHSQRSKPPVPESCICPPTRPISTRLSSAGRM